MRIPGFPGPTPPNLLDIQTLYISDTLEPGQMEMLFHLELPR